MTSVEQMRHAPTAGALTAGLGPRVAALPLPSALHHHAQSVGGRVMRVIRRPDECWSGCRRGSNVLRPQVIA
jgi:hypothetical protein